MAMPRSNNTSLKATAASYNLAPSPGSLAAHIQLPEHFTSLRLLVSAQTKLVSASPTHIRAIAAGSSRPLIGCSPIAVAAPLIPKWLCATTATSATVSCSGPTHCCCATRPVTARSTFVVRKRFEPTDNKRKTRSSAFATERSTGNSKGADEVETRSRLNVFRGISPSTASNSKLTGFVSSCSSHKTMHPSPVTLPTKPTGAISRAQRSRKSSSCSGFSNSASCSWDSAPQISSTDSVASPIGKSRTLICAPAGSTISFSTLQLPPAPWSWIDTMGLASPSSTQARSTRLTFCSISASPRCTALKSSSATFSPWTMLDAAPPPIPILYAGPPIFTTHIPFAGASLSVCRASICPMPPENMIGLIHSRRSPVGKRIPNERV